MFETPLKIAQLFIPIVAIAGVYIARQQFVTHREKVKLDLYEKRFKIYDVVVNTIFQSTYGSTALSSEKYSQFFLVCQEARFLLPNKAYTLIADVADIIRTHRSLLMKLDKTPELKGKLDQNILVADEIIKLESKLENLVEPITDAFMKVLRFNRF